MNEYYFFYKSHGICPGCGINEAAKGRVKCLICLHDDVERARAYRERNKIRISENDKIRHKNTYRERKERGVCVECGKRKPYGDKVRCGICLGKNRTRAEKIRRKRGAMSRDMFGDGYHCEVCGKPTEDRNKVCSSCYDKLLINLEKVNANQQGNGFRKTNHLFFIGGNRK